MARIVFTGGPSAGKTTLIDLLSQIYGSRIALAREAATTLFRSGYPRPETFEERIETQRQIYRLQKELERRALEAALPGAPLFCDRGGIDGSAYWPGTLREFCFAMGTTPEREVSRYTAVLHLQSASPGRGYTNTAVRTESHDEATILDRRLQEHWSIHPNYIFIPNQDSFADKLRLAAMFLTRWLGDLNVDELSNETFAPHSPSATSMIHTPLQC